jgi:hypothetical protein
MTALKVEVKVEVEVEPMEARLEGIGRTGRRPRNGGDPWLT